MEAATKKQRGRPKIFTPWDLYEYDTDELLTERGRLNRKYADIGLNEIMELLDSGDNDADMDFYSDLFGVAGRKRSGALEQIGRMVKAGYPETELMTVILHTIEAIQSGEKSRDIENRLRQYRKNRPPAARKTKQ